MKQMPKSQEYSRKDLRECVSTRSCYLTTKTQDTKVVKNTSKLDSLGHEVDLSTYKMKARSTLNNESYDSNIYLDCTQGGVEWRAVLGGNGERRGFDSH